MKKAIQRLSIQRHGMVHASSLTRVRRADTFFSRLVGLLSRKFLDPDEGLVIVPCTSIHTLGMKFAIDVVFIDKENKVLGVAASVVPNRIRVAPKGTWAVLELADGNASETGINLDDCLIFD